jgi:hypothetical protein
MDIDIECLREAKVENIERLATALGIALPSRRRYFTRGAYSRELIRAVMRGLHEDRSRNARHSASQRRLWS